MRAISLTPENEHIQIGAKIRASRLAQGLTIGRLAAATNLTKGFISRVERDETMPSVPTLVHLCQALSLPIGVLFETPEVHHVSLDTAPRINMGGRGADERLLTPRTEESLQLLRSKIEPNGSGGDEPYTVNCKVETVHVLQGSVTMRFMSREVELTEGDAITFSGQTPHTWTAGATGAEIIWVLTPAAWSGSV